MNVQNGNSLGAPERQFTIIGNPENRRVQLFCDAVRRVGLSEPVVVPYDMILDRDVECLCPIVHSGTAVRIDSPGESEDVSNALILCGARLRNLESQEIASRINASQPGEILFPDLWFEGYSHLLRQLRRWNADWMNSPDDIQVMFDKPRCQDRLSAKGIPVPERLGSVDSYESLRLLLRDRSVSRVFVKLESESSASGVVALQVSGDRVLATTSTELVESSDQAQPGLFNSLRLQRYTKERDVARLIDALGESRLTVERWLPKAGWRNRTFDLRVLVISGEVRHVVMRTSRSPLTNLHLGNERGDVRELLSQIPSDSLESAWNSCRQVADVFPDSLYFGIDLMFTPGFRNHAILEVNAFGDLLPGIQHRDQDTYTAELMAFLQQADNR